MPIKSTHRIGNSDREIGGSTAAPDGFFVLNLSNGKVFVAQGGVWTDGGSMPSPTSPDIVPALATWYDTNTTNLTTAGMLPAVTKDTQGNITGGAGYRIGTTDRVVGAATTAPNGFYVLNTSNNNVFEAQGGVWTQGTTFPSDLMTAWLETPTYSSGGNTGGGGTTDTTVRTGLLAEYVMVGGSGNTVTDTSGNGNLATLGPNSPLDDPGCTVPTWSAAGLNFDGNSILSLPDGSVVNTTTGAFSVELWVKPISKGNAYFAFGSFDEISLTDGSDASQFWPLFQAQYGSGSLSQVVASGGQGFPWGAWYQVVVTSDPTTASVYTYVNGNPTDFNAGSSAFNPPTMTWSAGDTSAAVRSIGNDFYPGDGVNAVFGEVRFYGLLLSAGDVLQNYNGRKGVYNLS